NSSARESPIRHRKKAAEQHDCGVRLCKTSHYNSTSDLPSRCFTWSIVHCRGALSGRQRRNLVPWRNRPPVKWSYCTSMTSVGLSDSHSPERSVLQRLGPPGARPVKPPPFSGDCFSASSFGVSSFR